jgi:hypothetical protein
MSCRSAAVEQTGSSKQHCAGADRANSPDPSGNLSQPTHDVTAYFILFNRAATRDEQGIDLSVHSPKSFVRGDAQSAIGNKRPMSR